MVALRPRLRLPGPVRTRRGALTTRLPGGGAALYEFVSGEPAGPFTTGRSVNLPELLGAAAAEIHALTPRLTVTIPRGRPLDLRRLRRFDNVLGQLPTMIAVRPARLREAIGPLAGALRDQVHRLFELEAAHRGSDIHAVLRHGDLAGHNLAVCPGLPLGVLDWDEAAIDAAETEFGLFLIEGGQAMLDRILAAYEAAGGSDHLEPSRIERAALQRHLEDLTVRFERALGPDPELAAAAVADVADWGVERTQRLAGLPATEGS
jgi:aminoglycoside phosphotransferase (APT) family kinase protein